MSVRLRSGESKQAIVRQGEAVLFRPLIIMFTALFFTWYFAIRFGITTSYRTALFVWTMAIFGYGLAHFARWYISSATVTSERIVSKSYYSMFGYSVFEMQFENMTSISYESKGIFSSLLDYGDIIIKGSGANETLKIENIRDPETVKEYIWEMRRRRIQDGNYVQNSLKMV